MKKDIGQKSFINRKRPAVEGAIEDLLGPSSRLDEVISKNPIPESEKAAEQKLLNERRNGPG